MKKLIAVVLLWGVCGFVTYGLTLGKFTHDYPDQYHATFAAGFALTGPFGLLLSLGDGPLHWRTKPLTTEQRWEAFHESAPELSRAYFEQHYN